MDIISLSWSNNEGESLSVDGEKDGIDDEDDDDKRLKKRNNIFWFLIWLTYLIFYINILLLTYY